MTRLPANVRRLMSIFINEGLQSDIEETFSGYRIVTELCILEIESPSLKTEMYFNAENALPTDAVYLYITVTSVLKDVLVISNYVSGKDTPIFGLEANNIIKKRLKEA